MSILHLGLFVILIHLSYSASDGSFSKSACITMVPSYRSQTKPQPNTDVNEYGFAGPVALDLEFGDKDKNVTIYTKDPNDRFIGFMLQVRYEAERYDSSIEKGPIGKFTVHRDDPFKCMDCSSKCDTIIHKGKSPKSSIKVNWAKPLDYDGQDLYLRYSIVMEKSQYWVGLAYPPKLETDSEIDQFETSG